MPLSFATPPADGSTVLSKGLQDLSSASLLGAAARGAGPLQAMEPHPIYEMGLTDLANRKKLDSARLVGWRYLLVAGPNIVQAAEISGPPPGGGPSEFSSLTTGYAHAMEDVFHKAEQLPEVAAGKYEIRALRVPALYVNALWLKDLGGTYDRFLVVPPAFPPFNPGSVYDRSDLMQLLHQAAVEKLALEQKVKYP